ncbi:MAG: sigma-B regulation protein RsbU (phosphoserine phosphatase) [Gammaproteobacteria bacterium]|jgi:sigma-B regulation protein RsbU (phosphoserine phosphatase)
MSESPMLELRFPSDPKRLRMVREKVQEVTEEIGCSKKLISDLVIAINEACMNIMQHAYKGDRSGEILLEIQKEQGNLEVLLTDYAAPIDPKLIRPRDLDDVKPGGLGTHFIQEIMDDCTYGNLEDREGNFLRMRKKII